MIKKSIIKNNKNIDINKIISDNIITKQIQLQKAESIMYKDVECQVCFDNFQIKLFDENKVQICEDCSVKGYIVQINSLYYKAGEDLKYPENQNKQIKFQDFINTILLNFEQKNQDLINQAFIHNYCRNSKEIQTCPNNQCNNKGFVQKKRFCSNVQCTACEEKWSLKESWSLKLKFQNMLSKIYTLFNTKKCPNCGISIKKNGGCMTMKCGKCNINFCWICMKFIKNHNYQACNMIIFKRIFLGAVGTMWFLWYTGLAKILLKGVCLFTKYLFGYNIGVLFLFQFLDEIFKIKRNHQFKKRNVLSILGHGLKGISYFYLLKWMGTFYLKTFFKYVIVDFSIIAFICNWNLIQNTFNKFYQGVKSTVNKIKNTNIF